MACIPEGLHAFFRLSPARAGGRCFAVRRGDVDSVANAEVLFSEHYGDLKTLKKQSRYPLGTIGEMLATVQDGLHGVRRYVPEGVPLLGVGNITEDGIDLTEVNRITAEEHERLAASQVRRGDLLVTITGRLGTATIYELSDPANLSAHVALCRAKPGYELLYLKHYLASRFGAASLTTAQIGSTHPHINVRRLVELPIPLPPLSKQRELSAAMEKALAMRQARVAEANALVRGLDGFIMTALGLTRPLMGNKRVFAVRQSSVISRFDPHFHLPVFAQIATVLSQYGSKPLGELARFSAEIWRPEQETSPTFRYIEISTIDSSNGEAFSEEVRVAEAPSRARMIVRENDIIVSLTRPHLGAIAQINHDLAGCVASTGFAVLRDVDEKRILRDYLWCALRSRLSLDQMLQRASGGNYPAISELELAKILIPIPNLETQERISTEAHRRRDEARRLRAEAEAEWQDAKREFESQLVEPVE